MAGEGTKLTIEERDTSGGSRATRRLRRTGRVPGVLYGGDRAPTHFSVDARELRHALAARGAVLDVDLGGQGSPAVLKDAHQHPVRGEMLHIDLLRVDLKVAIQAQVTIELLGADVAPGAKEGGVLEQVTREVTIEALPGDIPETITHDVSKMQINDTLFLSAVTPPKGVTIVVDEEADEVVVATLTPPNVDVEAEEEAAEALEEETGVVGEGAGEEEGSEADAPPDAAADVDGTPE